jgi:glycosyltransferase involved in cell wall biosynthesis
MIPAILWLSGFTWNDKYSSRSYQLVKHLHHHTRIVYIVTRISLKEVLQTFFRNPDKFFHDEVVNPEKGWTVIKIFSLFPWRICIYFPLLYRINGLIMRPKIRHHLNLLNSAGFIAGTCNPYLYNHVITRCGASLTFYDCRDEHNCFPLTPPWASIIEKQLLEKVDLVFASSIYLQKTRSSGTNRPVYYIANAVDSTFGNPYDFKAHPIKWPGRTVIGFIGHIGNWINFDLLTEIAHSFPDSLLVLVGESSPVVRYRLHRLLRECHNCIRVPVKPYELLPAYIRSFQTAIIPFKQCRLVDGISPLKLFEYVAIGTPVVSTYWDELEQYRDFVHLARTSEEFINHIALTARQSSPVVRTDFIEQNNWELRAQKMIQYLKNHLDRR